MANMADSIFEKGYVVIDNDVVLKGVFQKYNQLVSGLVFEQIWGEKNTRSMSGKFLAYYQGHFQIMEESLYDKAYAKGECLPAEIIFYGNVITFNENNERINNPKEVALVPKNN